MDSNQDQDNSQSIDVRVASVEPVEAPFEEASNANPQAAPPKNESSDNTQPTSQSTVPEAQEQDTMVPPAPQNHNNGAPVLAIIAAVLVAIGLAAVTIYAYIQSQDTTETTQTVNQAPPVTGEDIDSTEAEVDEALKSTEEADFPDSELTDQSLGL